MLIIFPLRRPCGRTGSISLGMRLDGRTSRPFPATRPLMEHDLLALVSSFREDKLLSDARPLQRCISPFVGATLGNTC